MLPSKSWKSAEVGVGRNHGTAVFDCNRRVLGVGDQLTAGSGLTAKSFQYVQVIGTGTQGNRILLGENFQQIVSFPASSFPFGGNTDFGAFLFA